MILISTAPTHTTLTEVLNCSFVPTPKPHVVYDDGSRVEPSGALWEALLPSGGGLGLFTSPVQAEEALGRHGLGPRRPAKPVGLGDKYLRKVYARDSNDFVWTDVYCILDALKVESAALTHAAKKVLCAGQRGHKDRIQDLEEAIVSLQAELRRLRRPQ